MNKYRNKLLSVLFIIIFLVIYFIISLTINSFLRDKIIISKDSITVMHGDTFKYEGKKIRLFGIDCPEKKQDFGNKAKECAKKFINNAKYIELEVIDTDRYGRHVAIVYLDGISLQEKLSRHGCSWVYWDYCKSRILSCAQWQYYQIIAKRENIGIWSDNNPIPPWNWRKKES